MRARRLFALPPGPSEEGTRLWRSLFETEQALGAMLAQNRLPSKRLQAAAALREAYIATRKLERYLRRCADQGVRPLIVGEAPNGRDAPFGGPSGDRLAALLGVERLGDIFDLASLLTDEETLAGGASVTRLMRERAAALPTRRRVVIACGRSVAHAFGIDDDVPFLAWRWRLGATVLVAPHPSGKNRWWNDEDDRAKTERSLAWIGRRLHDAKANGSAI